MKVAIIGTGRMGRRHIQVVQSIGLEVVGVCDLSAEALLLAQSENGIPAGSCYGDVARMLSETSPECVVVATTATTHCEYTCLAAEYGAKYVLCEKPLAVSLAECRKMIEVCKSNGVKLAVNHQMRFMDQYVVPKALLNSAEYGGLSSVSVLAGNFGLAMNGSHYFEMFRFMTDEAPTEVSAWFSPEDVPNPRGPQFLDKAGSVRIKTADGKRFYMDVSTDQGHGMLVVYMSRNGRIVIDELTGEMQTVVRQEEHRELPTTRYGMPFTEETRQIAPADAVTPTKAVLKALLAGENYPTGEDGMKAVEVLVAAHLSAENEGKVVQLGKDALPLERRFPWA